MCMVLVSCFCVLYSLMRLVAIAKDVRLVSHKKGPKLYHNLFLRGTQLAKTGRVFSGY